jgi:hypothetical protein
MGDGGPLPHRIQLHIEVCRRATSPVHPQMPPGGGRGRPRERLPRDCPPAHCKRLYLVPIRPPDDHVRLEDSCVSPLTPRPDALQRLDSLGAQYEPWFDGQPQSHLVGLGDTLGESQPYCRLMRDPRHAHVLTPGGSEPYQFSILAHCREAPHIRLPLRRGPLTAAASPASLARLPAGNVPALLADLS